MNRAYDLNAWKLFLKLSETKNLSKVAASEQMEVSTVSRSVKALEKAIGHPLFDKESRLKELTPVGKIASEKIRELIASYEDFLKELREENTAMKGLITISVCSGYAVVELPQFLSQFKQSHPDILFQVETSLTVEDVIRRRCDLAGYTGYEKPKGVIQLPREMNYYLALASPEYIAKHGMPVHPSDLKKHTVFLYNGPTRKETQYLYKNNQKEAVCGGSEIRVTASLPILRAVLDGHGVAIDLPLHQCYREILSGQLVPILPGWYRPPLPLSTIVNVTSWKIKRVRLFAQWFSQQSAEHTELFVKKVRSFYENKFRVEFPKVNETQGPI